MSETSEIINDCLIHYNSQHIQVRWDFYTLCVFDPGKYNKRRNEKGNIIKDEPNQECMAMILRVIETLTDSRRLQWHMDAKNAREKGLTPPQEPKEWPLELAYGAFVDLLYHAYGDNTVRNSIAVLLERGYIRRYQATNNSIPLYYLNVETVQAALKKQAEDTLLGVESNSHFKRHKRVLKVTAKPSISTPKSLKVTPQAVENKGLAVESNDNNIKGNTIEITDKKEEESIHPPLSSAANALMTSSSFLSVSSESDWLQEGDDDTIDDDDEPTEKMPAFRPECPDPLIPSQLSGQVHIATDNLKPPVNKNETRYQQSRTGVHTTDTLTQGDAHRDQNPGHPEHPASAAEPEQLPGTADRVAHRSPHGQAVMWRDEEKTPSNEHKAIVTDPNRPLEPPHPTKPVANETQGEKPKLGSLTPRAPKKGKVDEETQKRITLVYETLNAWMQKVTEDPDMCYQPTKRGDEAIVEMLACKPTSQKLTAVCDDMWNEVNRDGEYWWRGHGHMSVPAICGQYPARVLSIKGKPASVNGHGGKPDPREDKYTAHIRMLAAKTRAMNVDDIMAELAEEEAKQL